MVDTGDSEGRLELGILGPLVVRSAGRDVVIADRLERDLLVRLLVDANHPVSWNRLVDDLGPHAGPGPLARLGARLDPDRVVAGPRGPLLVVRPGELDAAQFAALTEQTLRLALAPDELVATLDEAERLWRGPALAGYADRPWARSLVGHLERRRLDVAADRLDALLRAGRPREAAHDARMLVVRFPREPRLWTSLALGQDQAGRHADALRTVRRARRVLGEAARGAPVVAPLLAIDQLEHTLLARTRHDRRRGRGGRPG